MPVSSKEKKTVVTPTFRLGFHALFAPKEKEKEDTKTKEKKTVQEYYITMIFDKDADLTELKNLVRKVKKDKWGEKEVPNWRTTFTKGEDRLSQNGEQREEYLGKIVLTAKNQFRQPGIVDKNRKPFLDESKLYPGCYCVASLSAFGYTYMGTSGVSFGLENIMKVADGERLAGGESADEAFKDVKSDYEDEDSNNDLDDI